MSHVICVANLDEKTGRTSTAVNFAASLSVLEKRVLLVDCDPAGNASSILGAEALSYDFGLIDLLSGVVGGRSVLRSTEIGHLDLIPTGEDLRSIDRALAMNPEKEKVLTIIIQKFKEQYDYIVFDTPADKGFLTQSALYACDSLIIPVHPGPNAVQSIYNVLGFAGKLRQGMDNPVKLSGILFNRCRDLAEAEVCCDPHEIRELRSAFFPVTIPSSPVAGDSRKPVCLCDVKSGCADAFLDLSFEFLYREKRTDKA